MQFVDLSSRPRIARLMDLTRALRNCHTPFDALLLYSRYLGDAFPKFAQVILASRGLPAGQYRVWRLRTDDGVEHVPAVNPWTDFTAPIYAGGALGEMIAQAVPRLVHHLDCSADPHFERLLTPYHSAMAVPLFNEGLPLNWSLMLSREPEGISVQELEESVSRATLIGSLLDSIYVGRQLNLAHEQIESELRRMTRIQRALLPVPIPRIPGVKIAASYETFTHVGGDIYDILPVLGGTERWGLFIGDASGHGPAAAVSAAMVQATLHACSGGAQDPAALFSEINRHLSKKQVEGSFVTAFMAVYEPASRQLVYSSAGHPPPFLMRSSDGALLQLEAANSLPLGVDRQEQYEQAVVQLAPGTTLLMYTDGITEARAPDGQMFGARGLEKGFRACAGDPDRAIEMLRKSVMDHQGGCRPDDDQTMVAVQFAPGGDD